MLKAYLQLFRIPNLATVVADILAGFLLAHAALGHWPLLAVTLLCSCLLYTAGMVLNDYYDIEQDRIERPHRPLVRGAIDVAWAGRLGYLLLVMGVLVGWAAGYWFSSTAVSQAAYPWRSGMVATALAVCVVAYDRWLKRSMVGPICMGACRFLNILLGASVASLESRSSWWFESYQLAAAGAIGIYIAGVTLFAQSEARDSSRWRLLLATAIISLGIGLLAIFPSWLNHEAASAYASRVPLLATCLGLLIAWRCLRCIPAPTPALVQIAVKTCLMSLIVLDAVIALAVSDAAYAIGILSLLIPNMLLGRWIAST